MSLHRNPSFFVRGIGTSRRGMTISCRVKNINFYEVLSLEGKHTAGFEEIKKAYRSMALQYHPDVCSPSLKEECTKRFVELRRAYETLSDPVSREEYDYELGFGRNGGEGRRYRFSSSVWEKQLVQLQQRSTLRMQRKKHGGVK